jgi:hypothetical protein
MAGISGRSEKGTDLFLIQSQKLVRGEFYYLSRNKITIQNSVCIDNQYALVVVFLPC